MTLYLFCKVKINETGMSINTMNHSTVMPSLNAIAKIVSDILLDSTRKTGVIINEKMTIATS